MARTAIYSSCLLLLIGIAGSIHASAAEPGPIQNEGNVNQPLSLGPEAVRTDAGSRAGHIEGSILGDIDQFRGELEANGFMNVRDLDPTIRVELKYSNPANFMGRDVYGDLEECYLRTAVAQKLVIANFLLKLQAPGLYLCVVDGLRPRRIQRRMWDLVKGTPMQPYVADPKWGSMHNYGAAVDLTIVDAQGQRLDMGTPVDYFGSLAQPRLEDRFLREGRLTPQQVQNRLLLREVMTAAGFVPISIEWWHFNAFEKAEIRRVYSIVE